MGNKNGRKFSKCENKDEIFSIWKNILITIIYD